jgi:predicted nucleotidyltransferase
VTGESAASREGWRTRVADAEVRALLDELQQGVRGALGSRLVGIYLFGSLAAGGFDAHSDVDVLVAVDRAVDDATLDALDALHQRLAAGASHWRWQLEVSYVPVAALRRYTPGDDVHPHLDRGVGERLHRQAHGSGWVVQRAVLRERGVALAGPPAAALIDPVSPEQLRAAMQPLLDGWIRPVIRGEEPLPEHGAMSYALLSLCRIAFTLSTGAVASKADAVRWVLARVPTLRDALRRAWKWRGRPGLPAQPHEVDATRRALAALLAWCERQSPLNP